MKIIIHLFAPGGMKPRFVGELEVKNGDHPGTASTDDLKLLWDVEQAINKTNVRCHILTPE